MKSLFWPRPMIAALIVAGASCAPALAPSAPAAPAPQAGAAADAIASDSVAAAMLQDVRELDPSIVVELRYATANNFTGAPLPGYGGNRAYLRREAAAALAAVNRALAAEGLALKVFDAYRPVRATNAMVTWAQAAQRMDLFRDGYIASRSRHNVGVAVDVTLVERATGRELAMGTAYDTFTEAAHTVNATGVAAQNRQRLVQAMNRAGFANYAREWWHFSYGTAEAPRFDMVIR
ncbi:MAG TPA: M15 family metallopeptidase [Gemmatimonadaceae bacterium]